MQISDTSGKQGIIQDITFQLGVDLNNYKIEDRIRNVNEWARKVWSWIFEVSSGWRFMDDNDSNTSTGVPYADSTITSGTGLIALPSGALVVDSAEIKTTSSAPFVRIKGISHEEFVSMGGDGAFPSTGVPIYYMLQGDVLRLLPTPNFTLATALRVYFDQDISLFDVTDDDKEPGFASPFHRILSIGPSLDYAIARGLTDKITTLSALALDYEQRIKSFYAARWRERLPQRIGPGPDLVSEYS